MQERGVRWWRELTRYQWTVLLVAWLGWVSDVFDTSLFFLAKRSIILEFLGPNAYEKGGSGNKVEGLIMLFFVLGWAIGGLVFGILADRWGRKRTLMLTIALYCAFTGLTVLCQSWQQVLVMRFLTALGIGGEWAAGTALVAEALPNRARAAAAGFLQTAAAIGPILASLTLFALADFDWRWLFVAGIAPALILIWVRRGIREPEKWIRAHSMEARRWGSEAVEFLTTPGLLRNTLVALVIGVVAIISANNMSYWLPNLVATLSPGMDPVLIKQRTGFAQMVMHIGTLAGVGVFPFLCETWGRKRSLALFFVLAAIAVSCITTLAPSYAALVLLAPVMSFFVLGLTAGLPLYFPELFPTRWRGTCLGLCYNTGRVLQAPFPLFTGMLADGLGVGLAVAMVSSVSLLGAAVMPLARETKGLELPD